RGTAVRSRSAPGGRPGPKVASRRTSDESRPSAQLDAYDRYSFSAPPGGDIDVWRHRLVRMRDVAQAVGVSTMTVSNVVNGRAGVGEEVRRRVEAELVRTGYRMNVSARNLRAGRSGVIGLAIPTLDSAYFGRLG